MQSPHETVELLVYFAHSPENGPERLIYDEEDIEAFGGVHALEQSLEEFTYWFVRLGMIEGQRVRGAWQTSEQAFEVLPPVCAVNRRLGRQHPAYGGSLLELDIWDAIIDAIERTLSKWSQVDGNFVDAYTLKKIAITRQELSRVVSALRSTQSTHCVTKLTALKYSCALSEYPGYVRRHGVMEDLILGEFDFAMPVTIQWSARPDRIVVAEIPTVWQC